MNNIRANYVGCVKKAFVPLFVLGACFAAVASNDWPAANRYEFFDKRDWDWSEELGCDWFCEGVLGCDAEREAVCEL